jgi:hypothetical protein
MPRYKINMKPSGGIRTHANTEAEMTEATRLIISAITAASKDIISITAGATNLLDEARHQIASITIFRPKRYNRRLICTVRGLRDLQTIQILSRDPQTTLSSLTAEAKRLGFHFSIR